MCGWMGECGYVSVGGWVSECVGGWIGECVGGYVSVGGWVSVWMDG